MIWIRLNKSEHARSLPHRTILVGIATLLLCVGGSAEDTLEPGAAELDALRVFLEAAGRGSEESLQTQIERLGSPSFLTRERASETIRSLALSRAEVVEALEGLKDGPDPELAARAQTILAQVRRDRSGGEGGSNLFKALARVSQLRPKGFAPALTGLALAADGDQLRLGWIRDALCAVAGQPESTTHLLSRLPDMPPGSAARCVLLQAIRQSAAPEAEKDAAAEQLRRMEKEAPHLADLLTFMDFSSEQVLRWKLDGDATDSGIHGLHGEARDTRPADDRHGREGKALQFVSTRTSVSHPDHPLLDLGSQWSILLWIKPEEPVAEAGLVQKWGSEKPERNGYALCFGSKAKTVKIYANAEYPGSVP